MKQEDIQNFAKQKFCIEVMNRKQEKAFIHLCRKNGTQPAWRGKDTFNADRKPIFPIYYGFVMVGDSILSGWCSTNQENVVKSGFHKVDLQTFKNW